MTCTYNLLTMHEVLLPPMPTPLAWDTLAEAHALAEDDMPTHDIASLLNITIEEADILLHTHLTCGTLMLRDASCPTCDY